MRLAGVYEVGFGRCDKYVTFPSIPPVGNLAFSLNRRRKDDKMKCLRCEATDLVKTTTAQGSTAVSLGTGKMFGMTTNDWSHVSLYACLKCGHCELILNAEQLEQLRKSASNR